MPALNDAAFNGGDDFLLWDAQLGLWTQKAIAEGPDTRQIDVNQVFNLAATRPDLLTGVDPAPGQPAPYGSVSTTYGLG